MKFEVGDFVQVSSFYGRIYRINPNKYSFNALNAETDYMYFTNHDVNEGLVTKISKEEYEAAKLLTS